MEKEFNDAFIQACEMLIAMSKYREEEKLACRYFDRFYIHPGAFVNIP